mmetsp:Transcript_123371/g.356609  ORF Transcript_123371/g.356609 Transcript_123371/m.356609 type:complete len:456 (-) Transcript_123371:12-1379(-)
MGSFDQPSSTPSARENQQQRIAIVLKGLIVAFVIVYTVFYRNTHLRLEPVTGNIYTDIWAENAARSVASFAGLPYCREHQPPALVEVGTCLTAVHDTAILDLDRSITVGTLRRGQSTLAAGAPVYAEGQRVVSIEPSGAVSINDLSLCETEAQVGGRRCGFVNEVDLLSFGGNFIPTFVQVVHQKASCIDGSADLTSCQLDFKTSPEFQREIDDYFIGNIELYKVQFTHAFQSETIGQKTMAEAAHFGIPDCGLGTAPLCFERGGGGHDVSSVRGLLSLAQVSLDSNNFQTNHAGHAEVYRTSGMKLQVKVHYTNVRPWWSWAGLGTVGYQYSVDVVPAQSVWKSVTLHPGDYRSWVPASAMADFGEHDRLLVWADGIEISAHVTGTIGHVDLTNLLLVAATVVPLMWLAVALVGCLGSRASKASRYETMDRDDGPRGELDAALSTGRSEEPDPL